MNAAVNAHAQQLRQASAMLVSADQPGYRHSITQGHDW